MRLFVAVNLSDAVRQRLYALLAPARAAAPEVRWVAPESLHITVQFLGSVDEALSAGIVDELERIASAHGRHSVHIAALDAFPSERRPRIWIMRVMRDDELKRLQRDVAQELAGLGFAAEDRPYVPHVTVGRARERRGSTRAQATGMPHLRADLDVAVETIDLMRSHTDSRGARYERLAAVPLVGE